MDTKHLLSERLVSSPGRACGAVAVVFSLLALAGCKSDDVFVVGGGPKPVSGSQLPDGARDPGGQSVAAGHHDAGTRANARQPIIGTGTDGLTGLADDLTGPILYATGDTLLLLGDSINHLGGALPPSLAGTTADLHHTLDSMTGTVNAVATRTLIGAGRDAGMTGGVFGTLGNTVDGIARPGGDRLLVNLTENVTGMVNETVANTGQLASSLGTESAGLLEGATGTIDGAFGTLGDVAIDREDAALMDKQRGLLGTGLLGN